MQAIFEGGYLPAVWESELIWGERMAWLGTQCDDLRITVTSVCISKTYTGYTS